MRRDRSDADGDRRRNRRRPVDETDGERPAAGAAGETTDAGADGGLASDLGWLAVGVIVGAIAAAAVSASLGPALGSLGSLGGDGATAIDRGDLTLPDETSRLHDRGVTGSNVTVGVLDATGFDADNPALRDRVVAARSFGRGNHVANGGVNAHGTAAAVTVAATAPDADLLLANADSPDGAVRGLQWLVDRDADVVVVQFNRLGAPDDGTAPLSRAVTSAREAGTLVVAPTGNQARGHWSGPLDPGGDGSHEFPDGARNYLGPLSSSQSSTAGSARAWLTWNGTAATDLDLTLELYRSSPEGPELVARSERVEPDAPRPGRVEVERLDASVEPGAHFVIVRIEEGAGAASASDVRLDLDSPTHGFEQARPAGSVAAPATARGVLAVGAYDVDSDGVTAHSGRGPTTDGRRGVDVVAPVGAWSEWPGRGETGTSVAAAYAGGTAALALDAAPSLGPDGVERALESSAVDVGPAGADPVAGRGRIDADAAVGRVAPAQAVRTDRSIPVLESLALLAGPLVAVAAAAGRSFGATADWRRDG
ncbi:S8 family serine peptidase [Halosimplex salinum]|uniref:S8 family serine peptidase n=1 Tax=Halosimplex salinum TaxID=1710538 RepID=UPI000F46CC0F|nr:S8 family serine peptidase [Halosimplex salinum]